MRVSLLKFEPKVSNFPVLEANGMASSTCATAGSLFFCIHLLRYVKAYDFPVSNGGRKQPRTSESHGFSTAGSLFFCIHL